MELIGRLKEKYKDNFVAFFDLHGHSVKKNAFSYGPGFPVHDIRFY